MTTEQAIETLRKVGKVIIRADKLKELDPDLHYFVGCIVYQENDESANDTFAKSPELMEIEFDFKPDGFTAGIAGYDGDVGEDTYDQISFQSSEKAQDAFVKLVCETAHV
jgi:hypothetical protein